MTAVVTVVFTSCPTQGGQHRNQFRQTHEPPLNTGTWIPGIPEIIMRPLYGKSQHHTSEYGIAKKEKST